MLKKMTATTAALLLAGLLAGCTSGAAEAPTETPTPTAAAIPSLKVPEKITGSTAPLVINGGDLERGTVATVYRFGGGWDGEPVTCDDAGAETREVTITGEGEDQAVAFPVAPGVISWVLVAGDFATECGGEGSTTAVLVSTSVAVYTGGAADKITVGQEKTITVDGKVLPETIPVTATVRVLGPWKNVPEAAAADCAKAAVAVSTDVVLENDINRVVDDYDTVFTPTEAGVYRVVVTAPETAQSTEVDTCIDESAPATFAVAAG
jgi:hypothetical protein